MTNEEAIEKMKSVKRFVQWKTSPEYEYVPAINTAIKALEDIEKIKAIIRTSENFLEQDVYRYKMICEVIKNDE